MERGEKENGKGNNTGKEKEKRKKWNEVGGKIGKGKRLETSGKKGDCRQSDFKNSAPAKQSY